MLDAIGAFMPMRRAGDDPSQTLLPSGPSVSRRALMTSGVRLGAMSGAGAAFNPVPEDRDPILLLWQMRMHRRMRVSALLQEARDARTAGHMSRHDALEDRAGAIDDAVLVLEERIANLTPASPQAAAIQAELLRERLQMMHGEDEPETALAQHLADYLAKVPAR
jgi:hypothetical protein